MIKERLYEESAGSARSEREAKFYTAFKVFAILFFVAAVFILSFAFTYVPAAVSNANGNKTALAFMLITYFGFIVLLALAGLFLFFLKNRFNVSYDYIFVEDELRITKVFNGKRRKPVATIGGDRMMQLGWVDSAAYDRLTRGLDKNRKPKRCTPNREPMEGKEFYYIAASSSLGKEIYIIECRETMLEYLVLAAGRNKLERK